VKVEISVRSAGVASIQLVVAEVAAKAERMITDGLADIVANAVIGFWLIEIQPVVADGEAIEIKSRHGGWVSWRPGIDQATGRAIGIEAVLRVGANRRRGRRLGRVNRSAEELDAGNVDRTRPDGFGVAHYKQLVARRLSDWKAGQSWQPRVRGGLGIDGVDRCRIVVVIVERPVP